MEKVMNWIGSVYVFRYIFLCGYIGNSDTLIRIKRMEKYILGNWVCIVGKLEYTSRISQSQYAWQIYIFIMWKKGNNWNGDIYEVIAFCYQYNKEFWQLSNMHPNYN